MAHSDTEHPFGAGFDPPPPAVSAAGPNERDAPAPKIQIFSFLNEIGRPGGVQKPSASNFLVLSCLVGKGPTHNPVSWCTPLFVTYDELHSPNHSSFHILIFATRGQSEPQQYIQSPSFTMTEGTAAWKAIRQTRRHLKMERARMSPTKI